MTSSGTPGGRFKRRRFGGGYDVDEVDAFLARAEAGTVTAEEVERLQLSSVFFGGYDERQVDDALDQIARRLHAANPEQPAP